METEKTITGFASLKGDVGPKWLGVIRFFLSCLAGRSPTRLDASDVPLVRNSPVSAYTPWPSRHSGDSEPHLWPAPTPRSLISPPDSCRRPRPSRSNVSPGLVRLRLPSECAQ